MRSMGMDIITSASRAVRAVQEANHATLLQNVGETAIHNYLELTARSARRREPEESEEDEAPEERSVGETNASEDDEDHAGEEVADDDEARADNGPAPRSNRRSRGQQTCKFLADVTCDSLLTRT